MEDSYLNGKLHGTSKRYKNSRIPVSAKDYVNGKKSDFVMRYSKPIEPTDYIPKIGNDGNTLQTLWHHLQEQAKEKFKNNYPSKESNAWIVKNYRLGGGPSSKTTRTTEKWT